MKEEPHCLKAMARQRVVPVQAVPEILREDSWGMAAEDDWLRARQECPVFDRPVAARQHLLKPDKTIRSLCQLPSACRLWCEKLGTLPASWQIPRNSDADRSDLVHLTLKD